MTKNARWQNRRPRRSHAGFLTLLFPLQSFCSQYNCVVMFLQGSFFASTSDSFEAGTRVSKSGKWTAAFDISYNIKIAEILWYFLGCQVLSFY